MCCASSVAVDCFFPPFPPPPPPTLRRRKTTTPPRPQTATFWPRTATSGLRDGPSCLCVSLGISALPAVCGAPFPGKKALGGSLWTPRGVSWEDTVGRGNRTQAWPTGSATLLARYLTSVPQLPTSPVTVMTGCLGKWKLEGDGSPASLLLPPSPCCLTLGQASQGSQPKGVSPSPLLDLGEFPPESETLDA